MCVQQSNQLATFIGPIDRSYSNVEDVDDFINDSDEEEVEEADDEDELLDELSDNDNVNPSSPIDLNCISDDSDY